MKGHPHGDALLQESRLIAEMQAILLVFDHGCVYAFYWDPTYPLRAEIIYPYASEQCDKASPASLQRQPEQRQARR